MLTSNERRWLKLTTNAITDEIHRKLRKDCINEIRITDPISCPPVEKFERRIVNARQIKDNGYKYGSYQLWYFADFTEIARLFSSNVIDLLGMYDQFGDCISVSSAKDREEMNKICVECFYDIEMMAKVIQLYFLIKQYKSKSKSIQKELSQIKLVESKTTDENGKQYTAFKSIRFVKILLYIDNMLFGFNKRSSLFNRKPLSQSHYSVGVVESDDEFANFEHTGLRKDVMKMTFNKYYTDSDEKKNELKKNQFSKLLKKESDKHKIKSQIDRHKQQEITGNGALLKYMQTKQNALNIAKNKYNKLVEKFKRQLLQ